MYKRFPLSVFLIVVCARAAQPQSPTQPPVAAQHEHVSVWQGEKVNDPFFWLREKSNPAVIKYLDAENAYTEFITSKLKPFSDAVYHEMLGHIKQTDQNVPVRRGDYFYYSRTEEGKQYPIRCRKKAASGGDGPEEVLLDANELAKGLKFLSVGSFEVSDDAHSIAYTTDTTGFRQFRLSVKDLRTGAILPDTAERVTSVAWSTDNRTLFYTTEDPVTKRSNIVWRHTMGDESEPIYQEKDQLFRLSLYRSKDLKMLFLITASTDTYEVKFLPSNQPNGSFEPVIPRQKGHKYTVEHRDGLFYIRTNRDAKNFRLVTAPVSSPAPENWKELVPHRKDVLLQGIELFKNNLVLSEKSAALTHFRVLDFSTNAWHDVSFPDAAYAAMAGETPEFTAGSFRFTYQSMITPPSVYDYEMASRVRTCASVRRSPALTRRCT